MHSESPTARRARLEGLYESEKGHPPRDMDEFLDWYSGYMKRCEEDAARFRWLARGRWIQTEHGLRAYVWLGSESDLAAWVDRQMERAEGPQEVAA